MKLTIQRVSINSTDKQGNPIIDKFGNKQERVGIQTTEYGDKWLSGFYKLGQFTAQTGDVIEVDVIEKGDFLNFYPPKKGAVDMSKYDTALESLKKDIEEIQIHLGLRQELKTPIYTKKDISSLPTIEVDEEYPELPF